MKIPPGLRKRALIVVDVTPFFLNERNNHVVPAILQLFSQEKYDLYIEATFHAAPGSVWDSQQKWTCPEGEKSETVDEIAVKLAELGSIKIHKETRSVFKGNRDVVSLLREKQIEEVHIVGLESNDCVLATAYESFDFGFLTYVIEECCETSSAAIFHEYALKLLREQNMTNHSVIS